MTYHGLTTLLAEIRPNLLRTLYFATAEPGVAVDALYPVEAAAVSRAVTKRREEFVAGRVAAREAMRKMGIEPQPVPMAEDRAPIWPKGVTGSITHSDFAALGVVASTDLVRALGVDLEPDAPVEPELISSICLPEEVDKLAPGAPLLARRIFSAKEAAYKAQYALSATIYGFDGMMVDWKTKNRLHVRFTRDVLPFRTGDALEVRQWSGHGVILSVCVILPDELRRSARAGR